MASEILAIEATGATRQTLPENVKPISYVIEISAGLEEPLYDGKVTIVLDILKDTKEISFHSVDSDLLTIKVGDSNSSLPLDEASSISYDEDVQIVTASFKRDFKKDTKVTLFIDFKGKISHNEAGFYQSYYPLDGLKKYQLATQFQPVDARKAFPCFDEPALKASFEIILTVDKHLTTISNMNIASEKEVEGGKKRVQFAPTPKMSSYLCAWVIGELAYIESNDFHVPCRIYAVPGREERGRFSLDLTVQTLKKYEELFGQPYPLPKLDQIAVANFSGGMENWGCIIYREAALLFDESTGSSLDKRRLTEVVQHELAHQWFGNLVTMQFWDSIWLNEGFATWMSWHIANLFNPEWKVWDESVADTQALVLDSMVSSRPIELPILKLGDFGQMFDTITYKKGSCVIRMISDFLGIDVFMDGIKLYMKRHAFGNTVSSELWDALSEVSGQDVSKVMGVWTTTVGYPLLTVTATSKGLHVKQNRFLQSGPPSEDEDRTVWPVLITLATTNGQKTYSLESREMDIPLIDHSFYKLNYGQSGFYRTLYPISHLERLGKAIRSNQLPVGDRIGLLDDTIALAKSDNLKTSALLKLLSVLEKEENSYVWETIIASLASVQAAWAFESDKVNAAINSFKLDLVSPRTEKLGWEFENDDEKLSNHKTSMFFAAGMAGNKKVVAAARKNFDAYFKDGDMSAIHPNIRLPTYAIVLQDGREDDFEYVLAAYRDVDNAANATEDALRGLGFVRNEKLLLRVLDMTLTDDVKIQNIFLPNKGSLLDPKTTLVYYNWAKQNFEAMQEKVGNGLGKMTWFVDGLVRGSATEEQLKDVKRFFEEKDTSAYDKQLAQSLEGVRGKMGWVKRDGKDVEEFFEGQK